jgi:hypothetical protein
MILPGQVVSGRFGQDAAKLVSLEVNQTDKLVQTIAQDTQAPRISVFPC